MRQNIVLIGGIFLLIVLVVIGRLIFTPVTVSTERKIQHDWTSEYLNLTGAEGWIEFGEKVALKIREVEERVEILEKERLR